MWEVGSASARMARPAVRTAAPNERTAVLTIILCEAGGPAGAAAAPPSSGTAAAPQPQTALAQTPPACSFDKKASSVEPRARAISRARSMARWGCRESERGLGVLSSEKNCSHQAKNPASATASIQTDRRAGKPGRFGTFSPLSLLPGTQPFGRGLVFRGAQNRPGN